jgi:hypothetical protein
MAAPDFRKFGSVIMNAKYGYGSMICSVATGAVLMWLLDPVAGGRRRALVRDKGRWLSRKTGKASRALAQDLGDRASGLAARVRNVVRPEGPVDDTVVTDRVRAKLGRYVSHPGAVDVIVQNGVAALRGPILSSEADRVVTAVQRVRGIDSVDDRLERHDAADIPALQGGATRSGFGNVFRPTRWSPTTRALAGSAAVAGAAVALSMTMARARRRRLEADLPPPF